MWQVALWSFLHYALPGPKHVDILQGLCLCSYNTFAFLLPQNRFQLTVTGLEPQSVPPGATCILWYSLHLPLCHRCATHSGGRQCPRDYYIYPIIIIIIIIIIKVPACGKPRRLKTFPALSTSLNELSLRCKYHNMRAYGLQMLGLQPLLSLVTKRTLLDFKGL